MRIGTREDEDLFPFYPTGRSTPQASKKGADGELIERVID